MTAPADIINHLGPLGQFLAGLAAFLTVGGTALVWVWKWIKGAKKELIEATSHCMQRIIRQSLEREAAKRDPNEFYTLDIEFEGGHKMAVPMFPGCRMIVSENIEMAVQDHNKDRTELGLWCNGMGTLIRHKHADNCETIHIERGHVLHVEESRTYGPGETWVIEPGQWHSAVFQNCYCRVIHRPPLTAASVRPVDLEAMDKVFPDAA